MLVLSRRVGEEIVIADHVRVRILEVHGKRVRIGVVAPECVHIRRSEICRMHVEFEHSARESIDQTVPEPV